MGVFSSDFSYNYNLNTLVHHRSLSDGLAMLGGLRNMYYAQELADRLLAINERLLPIVNPRTEYDELVAILGDSDRWSQAHALFSEIRVNITLPSERLKNSELDSLFIYVAENAAKTAYNCSGGIAPFDDDSFCWLLECEKEFLAVKEWGGLVETGGDRFGWFTSLWASLRRVG